ncbi:hypothetical protein TYRP_021024 [Tyrophagus putrescentiae]|nr:hypothetical protein TYRP_021024 [Tyrophagus putrescentiae]
MHLPSGTRMCLLLAFAFLLITTEYPEFSRVKESGALEAYDEPEEAWGYRRWGGGYGGYGGGWGYRRRWGYGGGWGYRRRCCWGKRR